MPTSEQIADGLRKDSERAWNSLTARQQEVCKLSTKGYSHAKIASIMGTTPAMVKKLIQSVKYKIGYKSNVYFGYNEVKAKRGLTIAKRNKNK